jgi:signal transduction histidine kinase
MKYTEEKQKIPVRTLSILASRDSSVFLFALAVLIVGLSIGYIFSLPTFFMVGGVAGIFIAWRGMRHAFKEQALAQRYSFLSNELSVLLTDLKDGVVIYSPKFEIVYLNPAAETLFGIQSEKYIGTTLAPRISENPQLNILTQTVFPSLAASVLQISEANEWPQVVDVLIGEPELKFHTSLSRVIDASGKTVLFIKIVRDETRERSIIQGKNEFINTAAHQLRTPLTAINWALESIKNLAKDNADIESVATEALGVSERALKITNDLLDVAKIEDGRFGYKFEDSDLVDFVSEVVSALTPVAHQRSSILTFDHNGIERLPARIDRERLGLALFNLIDNALKYNLPKGDVKVVLKKEGEVAHIAVIDSGVGIAPEDIEKLFKKFFRGSNIEQLEPNGNGLGLFITKNIIERHGGKIWVVSQLNRGSTFEFTIPLNRSSDPEFENKSGSRGDL